MSVLDPVDFVRASANIAESFLDAYYNALNGPRKQISSFYLPTSQHNSRPLPYISWNGEVLSDAVAFGTKFDTDMPWTHFEAQSYDVQVLNPSIAVLDSKNRKDHERNMSLIVSVSGYVRLHERKEGPMRGFSDSFVLVPNKEDLGGKQGGKLDAGRPWVIQTQNFRFVV